MGGRTWITWWFILYIRYSRLFWIYLKKSWTKNVNPSIRIYINKIANGITFKIKTWYCLKPVTPETMKSLGSTKSKIAKDKKWWKCALFNN